MNRIRETKEQMRIKHTPPTSKNSSQPPSRDYKSEMKKRRRKREAKTGHVNQERELVERPDKIIYALIDNCLTCQANLLGQTPTKIIQRQIIELPEIKPVVIETQQYEVICPCCGELQHGHLPKGLEASTLWHKYAYCSQVDFCLNQPISRCS